MTDRTSKVIVDALENFGCQPTCDARSLDAVREAHRQFARSHGGGGDHQRALRAFEQALGAAGGMMARSPSPCPVCRYPRAQSLECHPGRTARLPQCLNSLCPKRPAGRPGNALRDLNLVVQSGGAWEANTSVVIGFLPFVNPERR